MANQAMQTQARAMKALRMRLLDRGAGRPQRGMMLCVAAQASSVNGEKDCLNDANVFKNAQTSPEVEELHGTAL